MNINTYVNNTKDKQEVAIRRFNGIKNLGIMKSSSINSVDSFLYYPHLTIAVMSIERDAEDACIPAIPEVLERKFAIYVLLSVKNMPGATKSDVIKREEGNERTKFLRITELIEAGLITVDDAKRKHNTIKLYLTPKGQEVANHLERAVEAFNRS